MKRNIIIPRNNWQKKVEELGFGFHTTNIPYWDESAYYEFTMDEILHIEKATSELWDMCLEAVQYVIDNKLYSKFGIPDRFIPIIEKSWIEDHPAIYGRFDFGYDGKNLKLFEFNADTPTSLFEGSIVQWYWLQDFDSNKDQFNSMHEKLIAYWKFLKGYLYRDTLHFTCIKGSLEDLTTTEYMRDCAIQAGIDTSLIYIDDIGWDGNWFVDAKNKPIQNIFKLYPWEWLIREQFGNNIIDQQCMFWVEPSWKMILSNKAILPILWELFPECPYLLESYFEKPDSLTDYVKKPILSREGANVSIVKNGNDVFQSGGEYGEEGFIYQKFFEPKTFDGKIPVLGSWVIGQEPAGMGIREDSKLVTGNTSCFIPHLINQ